MRSVWLALELERWECAQGCRCRCYRLLCLLRILRVATVVALACHYCCLLVGSGGDVMMLVSRAPNGVG